MEIVVDRKWKKDTYTIGIMYINGERFSETIEDKDRGLLNSMSEAEIKAKKIPGLTAFPRGTFEVKLTYSPKFGKRTWGIKYGGRVPEIIGPKCFLGLRIHPANGAEDVQGCIGVGRNTIKGKVTQSTETYYKLMDNYIMPAVKKGEKIKLVVK